MTSGVDYGWSMAFKGYGTVANVAIAEEDEEEGDGEKSSLISSDPKGYKLLGIEKSSYLLCVYVFLYVIFLCTSAAVFSFLEGPAEKAVRIELDKAFQRFYNANPNVTDESLEQLITEIVRASNRGVSAARNATGEPNWSFGQSLFFASTIVTTIGYGHVTPLSRTGKIFCIAYAVIGIPLTLVLLSALVERLLIPTIWLLQWLNSRLGHLYQSFNIRILHLMIMMFILVGFFLLLPAAAFALIEPEWDYLDSFYYCFISLTTIGLGDYIPGDSADQPYRPLYKIITTCYLFLGITAMMLTLAVFYDIPQLNLGLLFAAGDDPAQEKVRLADSGQGLGGYGAGATSPQENTHRQVFRVRSRRNDSPSPEDAKDVP